MNKQMVCRSVRFLNGYEVILFDTDSLLVDSYLSAFWISIQKLEVWLILGHRGLRHHGSQNWLQGRTDATLGYEIPGAPKAVPVGLINPKHSANGLFYLSYFETMALKVFTFFKWKFELWILSEKFWTVLLTPTDLKSDYQPDQPAFSYSDTPSIGKDAKLIS